MLAHYVRTAFRNFRHSKFHTAINVLGLSMGLMCFVGAYGVSKDFLSVGSQYANSDRIYVISESMSFANTDSSWLGMPFAGSSVARYLKLDFPQLEHVARAALPRETAVSTGAVKEYEQIVFADPEYLDIFKRPLVAGAAGNPLAHPLSALVTEAAAKRLFGVADPTGKTLRISDAVDVTITGVVKAPPANAFGQTYDLMVSMDTQLAIERALTGTDSEQAGRPDSWYIGNGSLSTYVVLPADGSLTIDQLNKGLVSFADRRIPADVAAGAKISFSTIPLSRFAVTMIDNVLTGGALGVSITTVILVLGVLGLVISCVNYANLATAQAAARAKEIGVRKIVGARRIQVIAQQMIEATLLGGCALVIAVAGIELIAPLVSKSTSLSIDLAWTASPEVWAVLLLLIIATGVVAGGYPALVLSRIRPVAALRQGAIKSGPRRLRTLHVGVQFAVTGLLLILVTMMFIHNRALQQTGLNAATDPVVVINSALPESRNEDAFASALRESPAVLSVSSASVTPWQLTGSDIRTLSDAPEDSAPRRSILCNSVGYDFFDLVGAKVLAGRVFSRERGSDLVGPLEHRDDSVVRPVVIDRSTAEKFGWRPGDAIGKTLYNYDGFLRRLTVIGVVEDVPYKLVGFGADSFVFYLQPKQAPVTLVRVSRRNVAAALAHIDAVWDEFAPTVPIKRRFMDELFNQSYQLFSLFNLIFAGLAAFAMVISCIGLLGMASYVTNRRVHEIGIRKTLGASAPGILKMLLWDFSKPVVVANLIAWPIGLLAMQVYLSLFTVREPLSPLPFMASFAITLMIAWVTVGGQAWRAARVKPASVLKYE